RDAALVRALLHPLGRSLRRAALGAAGHAARLSLLHPRRRGGGAGLGVPARMGPAMSEVLAVLACAVAAASGVPGLFLSRETRAGERLACALLGAAGAAGLASAVLAVTSPSSPGIALPWAGPGGALEVRVDGLSALFLGQIFLLSALGGIYGLGYWPQA